MRNKVHLYIEGKRADLDDSSFLLLNYTAEDLSNPVAVKNSFSKQITLKGTPNNDEIFGHIYRNDRSTVSGSPYIGPNFDPCRKTSFVLYNDTQEILESGYIKLNEVVNTRKRHEYKITLYGSLGSFLYGLSYKADGTKMSLADLFANAPFDLTITRSAVQEAWNRLDGDNTADAVYDIINFAPCYTGLPPAPFDANKALVKNASVGLPDKDGDYSSYNGYSIVTLPEKVTGNEAKDYRSYLQTPVISMNKVLAAIFNSSINGGWSVDLDSEFFDASNPYYKDLWLTLPKLSDLNIDATESNGRDNFSSGTFIIPGGGNISTLYNIQLVPQLWGSYASADPYERCVLHCEDDWAAGMSPDDAPGFYLNYLEWEITGYDSADNVIEHFIFRASTKQPSDGFPQMDDTFDFIDGGISFVKNGTGWKPNLTLSAYGLAKVTVTFNIKGLAWGHLRAASDPNLMWPDDSYDVTDGEMFLAAEEYLGSYIYYSAINSSTVRTGAYFDYTNLLGGSRTPAEYLVSYCKLFGIQMIVDKGEKKVYLRLRKNFYNGGTVDLNYRIDRGKDRPKKPFSFNARWYLFGNEAQGDFAEYYANKYGLPFGQFRVNTGYEFDAAEKNLTDSIVFKNGCEVLETSKYFCDVVQGAAPIPAVFLGGGKYTLYKGGETKDYDLNIPTAVFRNWLNPTYPMHDEFPMFQAHGKENAPMDGRDVLLLFGGMQTLSSNEVTLSDDTREMLTLNANNPCWMPGYAVYDSSWKLTKLPRFSRYVWSGSSVTKSLDFGTPAEVQIPGVTFGASSPLFAQYWDKYITDRYDDDSAVVTCYVDLRGWQVNESLFRQFYAFDGAIWALNKIIDHSLTTYGPTKCEFVKVQDTTNYSTY